MSKEDEISGYDDQGFKCTYVSMNGDTYIFYDVTCITCDKIIPKYTQYSNNKFGMCVKCIDKSCKKFKNITPCRNCLAYGFINNDNNLCMNCELFYMKEPGKNPVWIFNKKNMDRDDVIKELINIREQIKKK